MIAKLLEDLDIYACGQHQHKHNNFFYYLPFQGEYREYREYMTLQKDKVTVSGDGPCDLHSHFGHRWKNLTHRARVSTEGGCRQRGSDDALHKFYMYIYCLKAIDSIHPPTHLLSFRHELAKELIGDFKSLGIALHHQDVMYAEVVARCHLCYQKNKRRFCHTGKPTVYAMDIYPACWTWLYKLSICRVSSTQKCCGLG